MDCITLNHNYALNREADYFVIVRELISGGKQFRKNHGPFKVKKLDLLFVFFVVVVNIGNHSLYHFSDLTVNNI